MKLCRYCKHYDGGLREVIHTIALGAWTSGALAVVGGLVYITATGSVPAKAWTAIMFAWTVLCLLIFLVSI